MKAPKYKNLSQVAEWLASGKVGVIPTDTLYGIVGSALRRKTVERIYRLRRRNPQKPMIILIGDARAIARFGVQLDRPTAEVLKKMWPGKISVVLPIVSRSAALKKFKYLHCGGRSLAFRLPRPAWLRALLRKTGPLVAPTANLEGKPPAKTIRAAKEYFGDRVDFYVDVGQLRAKPSTLLEIKNGRTTVVRQGAVKIKVSASIMNTPFR